MAASRGAGPWLGIVGLGLWSLLHLGGCQRERPPTDSPAETPPAPPQVPAAEVQASAPGTVGERIATVNGVDVPLALFTELYEIRIGSRDKPPREIPDSVERRFEFVMARRLAYQEILRQECTSRKIDYDPTQVEARVAKLRQKEPDWDAYLLARGESPSSLRAKLIADLRIEALVRAGAVTDLARQYDRNPPRDLSSATRLQRALLDKYDWRLFLPSRPTPDGTPKPIVESVPPGTAPRDNRTAWPLGADLHRFVEDGRYGFRTLASDYVIPARYDYAEGFRSERALVCVGCKKRCDRATRACRPVNGQWGFIDPDGREVVPLVYSSAESFRGAYAKVYSGNKPMKIDLDGKIVVHDMRAAAADPNARPAKGCKIDDHCRNEGICRQGVCVYPNSACGYPGSKNKCPPAHECVYDNKLHYEAKCVDRLRLGGDVYMDNP